MSLKKYFQKAAETTASGGGNYVNDGIYKFIVEKMFVKDSTDTPGGAGVCFITEFRVVTSEVDPQNPSVKPNAVGTTCSVVCNVTKHASAYGNVKAMLVGMLGAFGYTEDDITPEKMEEAFTPDEHGVSQLRGLLVEDSTYRKAIKNGENKGKPITLHKWTAVEQSEEDVARQRKDLDAGKYSKRLATEAEEAPAEAAVKKPSLLGKR